MIFFYGMAALFAAVLNTRGHFAAPMWTPILNNIVVIAMAGVLPAAARSPTRTTPASADRRRRSLVLGVGTTLGIVVQAAGLLAGAAPGRLPVAVALGLPRAAPARARPGSAPGCSSTSWSARSPWSSCLKLPRRAGDSGEARPARPIYNNAFLIFMMAHGIVAVSIITALMPRMAAAAAERPARRPRRPALARHPAGRGGAGPGDRRATWCSAGRSR